MGDALPAGFSPVGTSGGFGSFGSSAMDRGFDGLRRSRLPFTSRISEAARISTAAFLTHAGKLVNQNNLRSTEADWEEIVEGGSSPLKSALFVEPQIADQKDAKEHEHRKEGEEPQVHGDPAFIEDGPGDEEHRFHVEDHK